MGSFNKVGFHSHLPICVGDDIVYFICATYGKIYDNTPIDPTSFIEPISLPIFGKYNDYGSIDEIVQNHYTETIEKSLNMDIGKLIEVIEDCSFLTLNNLSEIKQKDKLNANMQIYEKLLNGMYEKLCYFTKQKCEDISLCVTMEHKSVYDTICNLHKHLVTNYEYEFQKIDFPSIFEEILTIINENGLTNINVFSTNNSIFAREAFERFMKQVDKVNGISEIVSAVSKSEEDGKIHPFDISNDFATRTIYQNYSFDMMFINLLNLNYNLVKDLILDFTFFNRTLNILGGRYSVSQYGCQDLYGMWDEFSKLNKCYMTLIRKLKR